MNKYDVGSVVVFQGTACEVRQVKPWREGEVVHYGVAIHSRPWPAPAELHDIAESNLEPYTALQGTDH